MIGESPGRLKEHTMAHFRTSLAEIGLLPGKATRRAEFFQRLEALVPWDRWVAIVDSHRDDRVGPRLACDLAERTGDREAHRRNRD